MKLFFALLFTFSLCPFLSGQDSTRTHQGSRNTFRGIFDLHQHTMVHYYLNNYNSPNSTGAWTHTTSARYKKKATKIYENGFSKKQTQFSRYAQASFGLTYADDPTSTSISIANCTFYSIERDLLTNWITVNIGNRLISSIPKDPLKSLRSSRRMNVLNRNSYFGELEKEYRLIRSYQPGGKIKLPVHANDIDPNPSVTNVFFNIEGMQTLMDYSPYDYMDYYQQSKQQWVRNTSYNINLDSNFSYIAFNYLYSADRAEGTMVIDSAEAFALDNAEQRTNEAEKIISRLYSIKEQKGIFNDSRFIYLTLTHFLNYGIFQQSDALDHKVSLTSLLITQVIKKRSIAGFKTAYLFGKEGFVHFRNVDGQYQRIHTPLSDFGKAVLLTCMDVKNNAFRIAPDVKHLDACTRKELYNFIQKNALNKDSSLPDTYNINQLRFDGKSEVMIVQSHTNSPSTAANSSSPSYHRSISEKEVPPSSNTRQLKQAADIPSNNDPDKDILNKTLYSDRGISKYFPDDQSSITLQFEKFPIICSHAGVSKIKTLDEAILLGNMLDSARISSNNVNKIASKRNLLYPLPISLTDEDIVAIYNSGGTIGFNLDQRVLGANLKRYKGNWLRKAEVYRRIKKLKKTSSDAQLKTALDTLSYKIRKGSSRSTSKRKVAYQRYQIIEPLIRNVMHTIAVTNYQVQYYGESYPNLKGENIVCLGSDFDGIIDPLDNYPTARQLRYLVKDFPAAIIIYLHLDPDEHVKNNLLSSFFTDGKPNNLKIETLTKNFFYENGLAFLKRFPR